MVEDGSCENPTRKRVRTGCLTCRRRRRKCDEGKPTCANCQNKRIQCRYGVNLTFLDDNASSLNLEDSLSFPSFPPYPDIQFVTTSGNNSPERDSVNPDVLSRNDEHTDSPATESGYATEGIFPCDGNSHDEAYENTTTSPQIAGFDFSDTPIQSPTTQVSYACPAVSPINPGLGVGGQLDRVDEPNQGSEGNSYQTSNHNPSFMRSEIGAVDLPSLPPNSSTAVDNPKAVTPATRSNYNVSDEKLQLLKYYRYEVAPWLDICDSFQRFGLELLIAGKTYQPLNDALFAISCRRQELIKDISVTESSNSVLYFRSSETVLTQGLQKHDQNAIPTYILLKFVDLMSAAPQDWERQMQNVPPFLLRSLHFQAFSEELMESVFWNYVRIDLSGALVGNGTVTLPVEKWFPRGMKLEESREIFLLRRSIDDWARYSMLLCAQVIGLRAERSLLTTLGTGAQTSDYSARWVEIWDQTQAWYRNRPTELNPVFEAPADSLKDCNTNVFPTVIFSTGCAILANQLHHAAVLLLLQCKPRTLPLSGGKTSPVWHAQRVCGIAASNDQPKSWDFPLLASLLVAARLMTHKLQHTEVLGTLTRVRRMTGWRIDSEIDNLRSFWSLSCGQNDI